MKNTIIIFLLLISYVVYGESYEIIFDEYGGRKIEILLPKAYETNLKRYPVIYIMDGHDISDKDIGTTAKFRELEKENKIEEMIVVGIHSDAENERRTREYVPFYTEELSGEMLKSKIVNENINEESVEFLDFLVNGIVKYIDEKYRTIPDKKMRAISGISHGGTFALWVGLNKSNTFSSVISISPSIWVWKSHWKNIEEKLQEAKENGINIWFDSGNSEFGPEIREFLKFMEEEGYEYGKNVIYYEVLGAAHSWKYFKERIGMQFIFFSENIQGKTIKDEKIRKVDFYTEYTDSWFFKKGFLYINPVIELENGLKYSGLNLAEYQVSKDQDGVKINNMGEVEFINKLYQGKVDIIAKVGNYNYKEEIELNKVEIEFKKIGLRKGKW